MLRLGDAAEKKPKAFALLRGQVLRVRWLTHLLGMGHHKLHQPVWWDRAKVVLPVLTQRGGCCKGRTAGRCAEASRGQREGQWGTLQMGKEWKELQEMVKKEVRGLDKMEQRDSPGTWCCSSRQDPVFRDPELFLPQLHTSTRTISWLMRALKP